MYQTMRTIYYSHRTAEKQPRFHIFLQKLFGVIFFPCTEGIILACTGNLVIYYYIEIVGKGVSKWCSFPRKTAYWPRRYAAPLTSTGSVTR